MSSSIPSTDPSSTPRPLNVAIIGAGIGGLTAAIELRQNGHNTTIFERSRFANEYGAAIHLAPNANGLLKRLGIDLADDGGIPTEIISEGNRNAELTKTIPIGKSRGMWQHGWLFCNRPTLHNRLKREALREDGKGRPVWLLTSSEVVEVETGAATVVLKDGTRHQFDVVVGADGAHSGSRRWLFEKEEDVPKTRGSGKNAYRFLIEKEKLREREPDAYQIVQRDGELISFYDLDRRMVVFPADNNQWLNVVCMHPEELSDGSGEEWNRQGDKNRLLEIYSKFSPRLRAILAQAPDEALNVWKLVDLDTLTSWTKDRFCVLGDAAHPMLPYNGQGGASAIEDAASLGVMLSAGLSVEDIPERLQLYQQARMQRAHELQDYSRVAGYDLKPDAPDTVGKVMAKLAAFAYGHDEYHHSQHVLREHLQSKIAGGLIWRSPVGFGPMPGPRQNFFGDCHKTSHSSFKSVSLRMKTSRTLLQNLLPRRDVLSFASASTVAEVTWKFQSNHNLTWLGGRGYSHFSLYLHGVQCKKEDGSLLVGDYLALMLEDTADPIVTGRDEIGFPKLFCDLKMTEGVSTQHTTVRASWDGFEFATMRVLDAKLKVMPNGPAEAKHTVNGHSEPNGTVDGNAKSDGHATIGHVKQKTPTNEHTEHKPAKQGWGAQPPPHAGLLVHRYVPAVGKKNEADADYIVCVPPLEGEDKPVVERSWVAKDADVSFDRGEWDRLPTLHHIVDRLEELPNLGTVEATIAEGTGVSDHKHIYRVC